MSSASGGAEPFVVRDRVRRSDVDAANHVNNAVYANYLEEARAAILGHDGDYVLARLVIDFRKPAYTGEEIEVTTRCSRIGHKSLDLDHRVFAAGRLVAEGRSVVVGYDHARQQTVQLSNDVRELLRPSLDS